MSECDWTFVVCYNEFKENYFVRLKVVGWAYVCLCVVCTCTHARARARARTHTHTHTHARTHAHKESFRAYFSL